LVPFIAIIPIYLLNDSVLTIRDLLDGTIYTLTETGYSLKPILDAMVKWGTEYKKKNG
jgi:DNA-binding HxlR family transcriptional regulator